MDFGHAGDSTDSLFSVINSGEDAGQVTVTGNLDREADAIHTMNIRVSSQFHADTFPATLHCVNTSSQPGFFGRR